MKKTTLSCTCGHDFVSKRSRKACPKCGKQCAAQGYAPKRTIDPFSKGSRQLHKQMRAWASDYHPSVPSARSSEVRSQRRKPAVIITNVRECGRPKDRKIDDVEVVYLRRTG